MDRIEQAALMVASHDCTINNCTSEEYDEAERLWEWSDAEDMFQKDISGHPNWQLIEGGRNSEIIFILRGDDEHIIWNVQEDGIATRRTMDPVTMSRMTWEQFEFINLDFFSVKFPGESYLFYKH